METLSYGQISDKSQYIKKHKIDRKELPFHSKSSSIGFPLDIYIFVSKNQKSFSEKDLEIFYENKRIVTLPKGYEKLYDSIEKSKYILELPDNWDDEGAKSYSKDTWIKAIEFISSYANYLLEEFGKLISTPKIYHGPDGSIDFHWKKDSYTLLLNIPKDGLDATFYGETISGRGIEATIELNRKEDLLLMPGVLIQ